MADPNPDILRKLQEKYQKNPDPQDLPTSGQTDFIPPPLPPQGTETENLRGPNRTEDIARLIQNVTRVGQRSTIGGADTLKDALGRLQDWAFNVDGRIKFLMGGMRTSNPSELYSQIDEQTRNNQLTNSLDFFELYRFPNTRVRFYRQDMWRLIDELFKVNKTGLGDNGREMWVDDRQVAGNEKMVNNYMLQLIRNSLMQDGKHLDERIEPYKGNSTLTVYSAPTKIPGVMAHIGLENRNYDAYSPGKIQGYPTIDELRLSFDASFLSGVQPLTKEQRQSYSKPVVPPQ